MPDLRELVRRVPAIPDHASGGAALARFEDDDNLLLMAVMAADGSILGMLRRSGFLTALAHGFGREIYLKRPVRLLMEPTPVVVDIGQTVEATARALSDVGSAAIVRGAIVLENGVYAGIVAADDVFRSLTRSLDQRAKALDAARREAEAARDAKANFLAAMSHEIRTPLNGILGTVQALRATHLDPGQNQMIEIIEGSGEVLMRLLDDVLDMSKIEMGKLELDAVPTDLSALLGTATCLFSERAASRALNYEVSIDPALAGAYLVDGARLKQVVYNLVSNAIKFTAAGSVKVVATRTTLPDGCFGLLVAVSDTGIGMDSETIARLFQPFEQADASITRRFGGSGLGLSICKSVTEQMGGSITVSSEPGIGSRFEVIVPLVKSSVPVTASSLACPYGSAPASNGVAEDVAQSISILVAEDNETNRMVIRLLLESLGFSLTFAENGAEAVALAENHPFDLVLMDLQMPVMDGLEAARKIRNREKAQGLAPIPIIALSANAMREHVDKALAAGMNDHVAKPVKLATLVAAIAQALEGQESGDIAPGAAAA